MYPLDGVVLMSRQGAGGGGAGGEWGGGGDLGGGGDGGGGGGGGCGGGGECGGGGCGGDGGGDERGGGRGGETAGGGYLMAQVLLVPGVTVKAPELVATPTLVPENCGDSSQVVSMVKS